MPVTMREKSKNTQHPASAAAVFAGGCFWCLEAVFARVKGVLKVESGYANGHVPNPTYEAVCRGDTGYAEVVRIVFDPAVIGYKDLLAIFFAIHDPTTLNRQGADVGEQYRSAVFTLDDGQQQTAQHFIAELTREHAYASPVLTVVEPLTNYTRAEEYHQRFFEKNPTQGYCNMVIPPKIGKLAGGFAHWLKD